MTKQYYALLLCSLLMGCSGRIWVHPEKSNNEFLADKASCQAMAVNGQMPLPQVAGQNSYNTVCATGGGNIACNTQIAPNSAYNTGAQTMQLGNNLMAAELAGNIYESCMRGKGWALQSEVQNNQNQNPLNNDEEFQDAWEKYQNFKTSLCSQKKLEAYYKKSACDSNDLTVVQLNDTSKANTSEVNAVKLMDDEDAKETQMLLSVLNQRYKTLASVLKRSTNEAHQNRVALMERKITWGQFRTNRVEIGEKYNKIWKDAVRNLASQ